MNDGQANGNTNGNGVADEADAAPIVSADGNDGNPGNDGTDKKDEMSREEQQSEICPYLNVGLVLNLIEFFPCDELNDVKTVCRFI